jgi:hypothetical protein
MCKITYLKSLGLSNFCEIWHRWQLSPLISNLFVSE